MQFLDDAKKIHFDEKAHEYSIGEQKFVSVTSFIDTFSNPFDPDGAILARKAKELKTTPEQLKQVWQAKGEAAGAYGTLVHESVEHYLNTGKIKRNEHAATIKKFSKSFKFKGQLFSEVVLFDQELGISGTSDVVQIIDDQIVQVHDFKTNEKPLTDFSFNKKMLPPISHLNDSKLNKYFLQITLYLYLLSSKYGYEIGKNNYIFWLNRKTAEFEKILVQLKMEEVFAMIAHWMYNKQLSNEQ